MNLKIRFPFSDYLEITTDVIINRVPMHRNSVVTYSGPLGLWGSTLKWKKSITQTRARRREGCHIVQYLC